jgi:IS30 family transposase
MEMFWQQRGDGATVVAAATAAGISRSTAQEMIARTGGIRPRARTTPSGRFLSFPEREQIALGWAAGLSRAEIARRLGRHRATIGRELSRNRVRDHHGGILTREGVAYRASTAQWHAQHRAARPKPSKLAGNRRLRGWVTHHLYRLWSPRQIAATLTRTFPDQPEMWVSHETIYQALYVQSRGGLRQELTECLRTGRAVRRPRRQVGERRAGRLPDMVLISDRPAEAGDRAVPGHWEGDLIIGQDGGWAIGTLVERNSRFVMLLDLSDGHTPLQVQQAMVEQMGRLPQQLRRSLTWDQGIEMGRHAHISMALDMPIYFCDPHSPWQRGSNENTNGLLRQYFPKSTDLSVHTRDHLDWVASELNQRPRQTLDWHTPAQRLNQLLLQ